MQSHTFDPAHFTIRSDGVCRLNREMARNVSVTSDRVSDGRSLYHSHPMGCAAESEMARHLLYGVLLLQKKIRRTATIER